MKTKSLLTKIELYASELIAYLNDDLVEFVANNLLLNNKDAYRSILEALSRRERLVTARKLLELAVYKSPNNFDINWWLCLVLLRSGEYKLASQKLEVISTDEETIKLDDTGKANVFGLIAIANLYSLNFDNTKKAIINSKKLAQWDLDACFAEHYLMIQKKEGDLVEDFLESFIKDYPTLFPPYIWMAEFKETYKNDPLSAINWYERAITIAVDSKSREFCEKYYSAASLIHEAFNNYLNLLLKENLVEKASKLIHEYGQQPYSKAWILNDLLIEYYLFLQDYEKTEELAKSVIKKEKNHYDGWMYLAKLRAIQSRENEARKCLIMASRSSPKSFALLEIASEVKMILGDWAGAQQDLEILITKSPFNIEYKKGLASCLLHLNNNNKAISLLESIIEVSPTDTACIKLLARAYFDTQDYEKARLRIKKLLKINTIKDEVKQELMILLSRIPGGTTKSM